GDSATGGATLELETGELPSHGAVLERRNALEAEQAQRTCGDDAARAPGAIDDDSVVIAREIVRRQRELETGRAAPARDRADLVPLARAHVADAAALAGIDSLLQGLGPDRRHAIVLDDLLAEPLRGNIRAAFDHMTGRAP